MKKTRSAGGMVTNDEGEVLVVSQHGKAPVTVGGR